MSDYQPQKGDLVRVVIEGEVAHLGDRYFFIGLEPSTIKNEHVVSVEKVTPPLPTTPGSVIERRDFPFKMFLHLTRNGEWVDDDGTAWNPERLRSDGVAEVIFDAGEVTR
jgi:hypothetical protein